MALRTCSSRLYHKRTENSHLGLYDYCLLFWFKPFRDRLHRPTNNLSNNRRTTDEQPINNLNRAFLTCVNFLGEQNSLVDAIYDDVCPGRQLVVRFRSERKTLDAVSSCRSQAEQQIRAVAWWCSMRESAVRYNWILWLEFSNVRPINFYKIHDNNLKNFIDFIQEIVRK